MTCPNGVFDWAALHNCSFGLDKFQLLDLRKKIPTPWQTLRLGEHWIPSKDTTKFSGVIVDNTLSWKAQCAAALAKGQDWLFRFKRIAMTTKGIYAKQFHQLYLSTAIPCILYAADIFLTPQQFVGKRPNAFSRPHQSSLGKLASIHRSAAIFITGALKTTATDAVLTLANLPPFHLLVNKLQHGQLYTSHPCHPTILCINQ